MVMPSTGIFAVCGLPGSGKTLYVVSQLYSIRRRNPERPIYADCDLAFPWGPPVQYVKDVPACFGLTNCDIFLDEVQVHFGARQWQRHVDEAYTAWVSQLRKAGVRLWVTAQRFEDIDTLLRGRVHWVVQCYSWRAFGFFAHQLYAGQKQRREDRLGPPGVSWFSPFVASCYDSWARVPA